MIKILFFFGLFLYVCATVAMLTGHLHLSITLVVIGIVCVESYWYITHKREGKNGTDSTDQ